MSDNSHLLAGSATKMYVSFHRAAHKDIRSSFSFLTYVCFVFTFVDVLRILYARGVVEISASAECPRAKLEGKHKETICIFRLINYPLSDTDSSSLECLGMSISAFVSATSRCTASSVGNS